MIPLVPARSNFTAGWSLATLWQDMLRAWLAHHQRMADCGFCAGL